MANDKISKEIVSKFGNQLRIRVNGILIKDDKLLIAKHLMGNGEVFWSVPGGGMNYGQSAKENLKREFREETGLKINILEYLFVHEFLRPPLHAMEHFFLIEEIGGKLALGSDPELSGTNQILKELRWVSINDLHSIPKNSLHQIFWGIKSLNDLGICQGYFNFENNSLK